MRKKIVSALFLVGLLLALSGPTFAARGYESYYDVLGASPWFNGVRSTIDYQVTTVDGIAIAVWCGIDNYAGKLGEMKWIQGGWARWKNAKPQIYWEYVGKNGVHHRGYDQAPGGSEVYEQKRNGSYVEWAHGDTVYKTVAWSKFDDIEFRKVQYGAEMLESPEDHTPGKAESKNNFASSMARRAGGNFAATGLNNAVSSAQFGNLEKYGDEGSGNFRTWDGRND